MKKLSDTTLTTIEKLAYEVAAFNLKMASLRGQQKAVHFGLECPTISDLEWGDLCKASRVLKEEIEACDAGIMRICQQIDELIYQETTK